MTDGLAAPVAGYIICGTPRSGSTLLCDMLTDSGAGRPASYFRREDIGKWADRLGVDLDPMSDPAGFDRAYLAAVRQRGGATGRSSPCV